MLIPSIDLLGGKVVQLVQGERKELEFDSADPWIERFSRFPIVQLIDLDAAMRTERGSNRDLVRSIASRLPVQVGGGIRDVGTARDLLASGARKIIFGSALFRSGEPDLGLAQELYEALGADPLIFAVDSKSGKVAVAGWKEQTAVTPAEAITRLSPFCGAFLYTHIDTEGTLSGFPIEKARELRQHTSRRLVVAGGIRSNEEVTRLHELGVDAVVGMAVYRGLVDATPGAPVEDLPQ